MPEERKWVTVAEAAEKSGYSVRTIQRLLKDGKIEGWKPGHDWFTTRCQIHPETLVLIRLFTVP